MTDSPTFAQSPLLPLDTALVPYRRLTVTLVVLIAILIRAAFFLEIGSGPLIWLHLWVESDMNHFHGWAQQIAAGDWLSRHIDPPQHMWHRDIADDFFKQHPEQLAMLSEAAGAPGDATVASLALWRRWSNQPAFWQDPLYPYLIAATYAIAGPDPRWVYLWQSLLGVGSVVLTFYIARRLFGETAATLAAGLALACGPLLIDEFVLLRTTCVMFAGLGIAALLMRASDSGTWWRWLTAGAATGTAMLLQSQFQVVALLSIVCIAWFGRSNWQSASRAAASFAIGAAMAMSPLFVRNLAVGLPAFTTPISGTLALMTATEYGAGTSNWHHDHAAEILVSTGGRLVPAYLAALRTYPDSWSYPLLLLDRLLVTWHGYEAPNNHNYYQFLEYSSTLRSLPVTFALIAPLALVGLVRGAARIRQLWPLFSVIAMSQLVMLLLYTFARFRIPMVAALIPLAAFGTVSFLEWARRRRFVKLGTAFVSVTIVAAWTFSNIPTPYPPIRFADVHNSFLVYYTPRIDAALEAGDVDSAIVEMTDALRYQPSAITRITDATTPQTSATRDLCRFYAWKYGKLVELYQQGGQPDRAAAVARRGELLWKVSEEKPAE